MSLNGLQALRAIAALMVVADHALCTYREKVAPAGDIRWAWLVGDVGVWMFFVISGLTMVMAHGSDFGVRGAPLAFARRRVGRIVPLYWLVTGGTFVELTLKHVPVTMAGLGLSLMFVPHQPGNDVFGRPIYGPGWTLEYEMFFYAVFCVCLSRRRAVGLGALVAGFLALAGASWSGVLPHDTAAGFLSRPIVLLFVAGVLLGRVRQILGTGRVRWGFGGVVSVSAVALTGALLWAAVSDPAALPARAACVAAAVVSVGAAALAVERAPLSWLGRGARSVGDATFSIYMTHELVLGPCGRATALLWPEMPRAGFVAFTMGLAVLFGLAVFRFVERPLVRAAGRLLDGRAGSCQRSGVALPGFSSLT